MSGIKIREAFPQRESTVPDFAGHGARHAIVFGLYRSDAMVGGTLSRSLVLRQGFHGHDCAIGLSLQGQAYWQLAIDKLK